MRTVSTLLLLASAPMLMGAVFGARDPVAEKAEMVAKLSSDINKVDHSIDVTKELIKKSPDAPYLAALHFRLAELYVERSRYVYARIMETRPEGQATLSGEQALEVQISKKLAIETYSKILTDFPEYDKNDQIRFFKAHEYRELGEFETMLKEYKDLISKHPKSDWAVEARLILGDHHFDKGEIDTAEKYYTEILAMPETHLHDMARYKLGWIRINQERFKDSLTLFESAVKSKRHNKKGAVGDAKSLNVKREALLAMVWPFSEVRKAYQAPDYFRSLASSKTLYVAVLNKLANRYFVKTEYVNSALLYREIVRLSSDIGQNTEYVTRIYESVRGMSAKNPRRYAHAATDVDAIVKTVARFQNHWEFSEENKTKMAHDFEIRARDLATRLHKSAQAKGDSRSAYIAAEAYRKYLSLFVDAKERQKIQENRASALYQAKNYLDAGLQYEDIAKNLEDGPERRDTLYQSILAFHKSLDEDTLYREKNPTSDGLLTKLDLLRSREGLKQLGAYYVKTWPKNKNTPKVKFNVARMFYQQGEYEKSAELFKAFVEQYPTHSDAGVAGNLALDALHKLDDYEGLVKLAEAFVGNKAITDNKFKAAAAKIGDAARKRNVEFTVLSTSEGDFSQTMLGEWEKHKGSKEGEEYLYTAFVKYKSEGHVAGVFDFGGRIIGAYPDSERLVDVFGTMGSFAVRAADFERAAFLFEEYHKRFPDQKNANDLLFNAANMRLFLGDTERATESFRELRRIGNAQQRLASHQKLMEAYTEVSDWSALARVAQTALQDNNNWMGAAFHLGLAYLGEGKLGLAQRELAKAASTPPQDDWDANLVGRANFELGRLLHQQFDQIQFRDVESAEVVLGEKLQYLQAIEQAYTNAIGSGQGNWGIAGLHEFSRAYRDFGTFIAGAPVPDGLSAADAQNYKAALAQQGQPYAAKAQETLSACGQKAEQLKIFTAYAAACMAGSMDPVDEITSRLRTASGGDDAYQKELAEIRQNLAKTPESVGLLLQLARRAMTVGDYHLAKLTLSKAAEAQPQNAQVQNLLGVANWSLGKPAEAYASFAKAKKGKLPQAAFNLAALYQAYGYGRLATRARRDAGDPAAIDITSPDVHPNVEGLLREPAS